MANPKQKSTTQSKTEQTVVTAAQIDPNSPEADLKVIETLYKMVTEDKNTTVAIFWAKARCGMSDKSGSKKEQKTNQAPTIVIRTEEKHA